MTRILVIADRASLPLLKLVAAINILFLLAFLATVVFATTRARAEEPACTGIDMMAELERTDPQKTAEIRTAAAATSNGSGLLWKIEKAGQEPSYLFGTMHITDPRVTRLTPQAQAAFDGAATVVIETTEVLDQSAMLAAIMARPELTMFTDATTLNSLLSPQDAEAVNSGLAARGIPPASVAKMKPWMLSAMLAMPACELARKAAGAPILDVKLAEQAKADGKSVKGLETIVGQLEAMASLPMEFHMRGLVETLKLGDKVDDVIETMIVLYLRGDTGSFWPLFRAVLPTGDDEASGYAAFEETMITARNRSMAENAGPILSEGAAFIAVGALHLPGDQGLVALLRKAGYTVTPAG